MRRAIAILGLLALTGAASPPPRPIFDRSPYLAPGQATTDDVQRLPVPAGTGVPRGSFVLVGGSLFDGTGAPARAATVVIARSMAPACTRR